MSNPVWPRLPAALLVVVLLGGCAGGDEDADTLAICSMARRLNAPGLVVDIRTRWRSAAREHPDADPRLQRAFKELEAAVVDERTLDLAKWNAAHRRVRDVCRGR